ncbi:hypothetical protein B0H13DRAFT_2670514 [Mycena leptocephala]|nr:hypothetical protein B0H13DRAFT_2670514 [Mycena leptocephala]
MVDSPTHFEAVGEVDARDSNVRPVAHTATDCQRLSDAIDSFLGCNDEHADRLVSAIHQQSISLRTAFENLTKTVEALKQQPLSTDTKTTFWTAYKNLADEFDKEVQRKYGNDLDTSLIFAGLFSGVSSAFIIQIQPQLQPDTDTTQALLGLLVQNITGVPAPAALLVSPTGPTTNVVAAQSLLYFSLFSTLLAALLAVLGKQWLLHYDSVGERGTIQERGLERQRKFDGLRRWKFDVVMQMFPLLLQFSLLLFATALSLYLWTIHRGIAVIILALTALGFTLYTIMVISAVTQADSPFQSSLSVVLKIILLKAPLPDSLRRFGTRIQKMMATAIGHLGTFRSQTSSAFAGLMNAIQPLLPLFHSMEPDDPVPPEPTPLFDPPTAPSKEVSAVIWALETSTDPVMVHIAAAMVPELQWWPVNFDVRPSLKRLADTFRSCFHSNVLREGMGDRATACFKAFGVFEMVTDRPQRIVDYWSSESNFRWSANDDLQTMIRCFQLSRRLGHRLRILVEHEEPAAMTQWALGFLAAQELPVESLNDFLSSFKPNYASLFERSFITDFLFCLNSFFSPTVARDRSVLDKSKHIELLITLLFENLVKHLNAAQDHQIVDDILSKLARFSETLSLHVPLGHNIRCRNASYRLCATFPLSLTAIASALRFVRVFASDYFDIQSETLDPRWVYATFERLHDELHPSLALIRDLLQLLCFCRPIHDKPSAASLRLILFSLRSASSSDPRRERIKELALRVFCHADNWFSDDELGPILAEESVWRSFAHSGNLHYTILGEKLSNTLKWKWIISQDLPGWLDQDWPRMLPEQTNQFCAVLSRVWDVDEAAADRFDDEKTHAMIFMGLANVWDRVDFSSATQNSSRHVVELLECTVSTAFSLRIEFRRGSQRFTDTIVVRLGDAVERAGERAKQEIGVEQDSQGRVADFLSRFAQTIKGQLRNPQQPQGISSESWYWKRLRDTWLKGVAALRRELEPVSPGLGKEGLV